MEGGRGLKLATHLHLLPKLTMSGATMPLLHGMNRKDLAFTFLSPYKTPQFKINGPLRSTTNFSSLLLMHQK
jgi:hypothetical protein